MTQHITSQWDSFSLGKCAPESGDSALLSLPLRDGGREKRVGRGGWREERQAAHCGGMEDSDEQPRASLCDSVVFCVCVQTDLIPPALVAHMIEREHNYSWTEPTPERGRESQRAISTPGGEGGLVHDLQCCRDWHQSRLCSGNAIGCCHWSSKRE